MGCFLKAGEGGEVRVGVSGSGLEPGNYSGTIQIRNDSLTKTVGVNLTLTSSEEICDDIDNDCDGAVDEGCCEDGDGDGHYAIDATCSQGDDCNDSDPEFI
ncbi:MAG: hypothetical protein Fur0020_05260 [Thermodesulfovibrionia bacterium]